MATDICVNSPEASTPACESPAVPDSDSGNTPAATAPAANGKPGLAKRLNRAFGPIAAGVIIDLIDLSTFGPIGLLVGVPIGALAGWWLGSCLRLEGRARLACALAAAVYCTIPFTELLPLGTLAGAYARFRESDREEEAANKDKA